MDTLGLESALAHNTRRSLVWLPNVGLALAAVSERAEFVEPLRRVQKQAFSAMQHFRDRLSERTLRAFGVPLRTSETEIAVEDPAAPNVRGGRVFDRNWELLSPVLPVWTIRSRVHRDFSRTISRAVYQNISRLSSQWEENIHRALWDVEKESRRFDDLPATVESLVANASDERIPEIRADLERIDEARRALQV